MVDKSNKAKEFWGSYRNVVVEAGIPKRKFEWYVRCAELIAKSMKNKPLHKHGVRDIKNVLSALSGQRVKRRVSRLIF